MKKRIHITGVSGFVGSNLCNILKNSHLVEGSGRGDYSPFELTKYFSHDWRQPPPHEGRALADVDTVIHCVGLAHEVSSQSDFNDYYEANVNTTINVFSEAVSCGVKRFIFMSSIAVYGVPKSDKPIDDKSIPLPDNSYGETKFIAEQKLLEMARNSNIEIVVIRPPMVVGPDAPGNLNRLLRFLKLYIPFPLINGAVYRSLISIESLAHFCDCVLEREKIGKSMTVNLANTPAIKLQDLVKGLREGLGVKMFNIVVPEIFLALPLQILGLSKIYRKIYSSLVVLPSPSAINLGWDPHEDWDLRLYQVGRETMTDTRPGKIS